MRRAMICFTRVPRPGETKTRLMPFLGGEGCAALHRAFLRDLSAVYQGVEADLLVAYAPAPHWEELREIFPTAAGFFPQVGTGLGERMHRALRQALCGGYDACILTGSDLPAMTPEHLESGFRALEEADITLGPSPDGGYYLVGVKRPCPEIFAGQVYGTSTVYESALAAAEAAGYTVRPALSCGDVDTWEELRRLWEEGAGGANTMAFLHSFMEGGKRP